MNAPTSPLRPTSGAAPIASPAPPPTETNRREIGVIVNPAAGGGRGLRLLPRIVAGLRAAGCLCHVHVTAAPGEATDVAAAFARRGLGLVVAVGGDGTVNEVANGLIAAAADGDQAALGVVPAGRGADFVRSLGLPRNPDAALLRIVNGTARPVDVGRVRFPDGASRAFANVAGVGFDAAVAARAARSHLPGATAPYLVAAAGALFRERPRHVTVNADGVRFAGRVLAVLIANGHSFGGGLRIVPDALTDDGCLDVAIVGDLSPLDLVRTVPLVYRGNHVRHPKFTLLRACSIEVGCDLPIGVQLDGEVVGAAPVVFTVEPGALRVVV